MWASAQASCNIYKVGVAARLTLQGGNFLRNTDYAIGIPVINSARTLLTLSLNADSLTFTVRLSPGKFEWAQICPGEPQYKTTVCESFEPLKTRGYLHARVKNVGKLPASYSVQVHPLAVRQQLVI
jgi:hypothetical protein